MAVMMVRHVGIDVRLIVIQIDRLRLRVVRREGTVVVRGRPAHVVQATIDIPHRRTLDEDRTNDVVVAVQIAITDDLDIESFRTVLRDKRSYVLEHTRRQARLNQQGMIRTTVSLNHAQVIDPTVVVEIEVVDHIPARVDDLLELLNRTTLGESRSHRIEVEIKTRIGVVVRYRERRDGRYLRRRCRHLGRIDGLYRRNRLSGRHFGIDACYPTTGHA